MMYILASPLLNLFISPDHKMPRTADYLKYFRGSVSGNYWLLSPLYTSALRFARAPQKRLVTEATERVMRNESVLFLLHIQELVHKCFSAVCSIMNISNKRMAKTWMKI